MSKMELKPVGLAIAGVVVLIIVGFIEAVLKSNGDGSLLLSLSFFVALVQGSVAVVAVAEAAKGKWIEPLKKDLLAFYPLIPVVAVLFLFLGFHFDIYPWVESHHQWLSKPFFLLRNFIMLLISFVFAHFFAQASLQEKKSKGTWAILYIFSFVITQSLVAFDWVMSLEFPWVSTLFGGIFFMEAFYTGLALLGIIAAYLLKHSGDNSVAVSKVMKDAALFMFGFALAWAGLFYAQYLVIWYGNLPGETGFFTKRMHHSPFQELLWLHVFLLFIFPFVGLLAKKAKAAPGWVTTVSLVVFAGVLVERIYYILPVTSVNFFWLVVEFVLIAALLLVFFAGRKSVVREKLG